MKPAILMDQGFHNNNPKTNERLMKGKTYKDLSTICIVPTRGMISARVVQNWMGLMMPMNQKFMRVFAIGLEVGEAYSMTIQQILDHPELSRWKYILTMEEDNMPPPDGLLKLYESIEEYDVVGGLYWTKGEAGQPMSYGDPNVHPMNFIPQIPALDSVTRCNGLGMGFNLWKMEMFKDKKLPKPFFKTLQSYEPNVGTKGFTQDLYFFEQAGKLGYKFACDSRIKVGHYDYENDIIW